MFDFSSDVNLEMGGSINGVPLKWMVYVMENPDQKWMIENDHVLVLDPTALGSPKKRTPPYHGN